jgi:hypothetical protein
VNDVTLGRMDMGDIVAGAFGIYRRAALPWLAITAVSFLLVFALQWSFADDLDLGSDPTEEQIQDSLPAVSALLIGTIVADLFAHLALTAAAVRVLSGAGISIAGAYASGLRFYLPALAGSAITGIVAGLCAATILLIPLAVFIFVNWSLITQVIVAEHVGPIRALGRSRQIVRGQWWRTFGIFLAIALLSFLPTIVFGRLTSAGDAWLVALGAAVSGAIAAPFVAIAQTLLYADLRARKGEKPFARQSEVAA